PFDNLAIAKVGTGYTLTASGSALTPATTSAFAITAPDHLAISVQPPASTSAGTPFGLTVQVRDAYGNLATGSSASVALALNNAGGATLGGTTTMSASSGVAAFSNLAITKTGTGYSITASSTGLTPATSSSFAITAA